MTERISIDDATSDPQLKLYLSGPPGTGKTTRATQRLRWLVQQHTPDTSILVLLPQRLLAGPYYETLHDPGVGAEISVDVLTFDGLARRVLTLFWPLIADRAGFAFPDRQPVFLTVESAQFFMRELVDETMDDSGHFGSVTIDRSRLVSQLLDNLNKAALVGITLEGAFRKLTSSWGGESAFLQTFAQAHACAVRFREFCLAHNLLDFSLQIDVFCRFLFVQPAVRAYLFERYRHLIVDNIEEDTPVLHDLLLEWVTNSQSALLIEDSGGGHRVFLGADPSSARRLTAVCAQRVTLTRSLVASADVVDVCRQIGRGLGNQSIPEVEEQPSKARGDFRRALRLPPELRFHHEMLDWVVAETGKLIRDNGVAPSEIAVVAPFVSDALRYSLLTRFAAAGIPATAFRASRPLRDEPPVRCLLTLARLAHPWWQDLPPMYDVALALTMAISDLDLIRARLLSGVVFRASTPETPLGAFEKIEGTLRERIRPDFGERFDFLRQWLSDYAQCGMDCEAPLDVFLSRLLGEVLTRPGYGFHPHNYAGTRIDVDDGAARVAAAKIAEDALHVAGQLVSSARGFRQGLENIPGISLTGTTGAHVLRMVQQVAIAGTQVTGTLWSVHDRAKLLVAPVHTFLAANRCVGYQFWLDAGSNGWWERIYQPLTHPYVLRRDWTEGRVWTDEDEYFTRQSTLARLVAGLAGRCRHAVFLATSTLDEQGREVRGPVLQAVQAALRRAQ